MITRNRKFLYQFLVSFWDNLGFFGHVKYYIRIQRQDCKLEGFLDIFTGFLENNMPVRI